MTARKRFAARATNNRDGGLPGTAALFDDFSSNQYNQRVASQALPLARKSAQVEAAEPLAQRRPSPELRQSHYYPLAGFFVAQPSTTSWSWSQLREGTRASKKTSTFNILVSPLVEAFLSVLDGQAAVAYDSKALSLAYCRRVFENFANSPYRRERKDGVPGDEIGATQYGKPAAEYMRHASATKGVIDSLLGGYEGEIPALLREIATAVDKRGWRMRPSVYQGESAPTIRLVRWLRAIEAKRLLLELHDDFAQTRGYSDWEISQTTRVIAINFYLSGAVESGQLLVSPWQPTAVERNEHGVSATGYPYPDHLLLDGPHIVVPAKTGSAVVLDGSHAHGVALGDGNVENRLVGNCFLGVNYRTKEIKVWA